MTYREQTEYAIAECMLKYGSSVTPQLITICIKNLLKKDSKIKECEGETKIVSLHTKMTELHYTWYVWKMQRVPDSGVIEGGLLKSKLIPAIKANVDIMLLNNRNTYQPNDEGYLEYFKALIQHYDYFPAYIKKNPSLTAFSTKLNQIIADVAANRPKNFIPTNAEPFFNARSNKQASPEIEFADALRYAK